MNNSPFDVWFASFEPNLQHYSCYEEYTGSIYDLMEKAFEAGIEAGREEERYKCKEYYK